MLTVVDDRCISFEKKSWIFSTQYRQGPNNRFDLAKQKVTVFQAG